MRRPSTIILAGIASVCAAALHAHDGRLDVIDRGYYACETPGDAEIGPGIAASEYDFLVISASRYRTPDGTGSYLRTGDKVQMTSGPKKGEAFEMKGERFLEMTVGKGAELGIRCIRAGAPGLPLSAQRD